MTALKTPALPTFADATVSEVSSHIVVSCAPATRLAAVAATMASQSSHMAVILAPGARRALVISALDLIRAALDGGLDRTAAEIARGPMASIGGSAKLSEAVTMMARRDVAHLLVAEPGADRPAGVLSSLDVASVLAGRDPALTRTIRPEPARPLVSATSLSATTVGAVMHRGVATRTPGTLLDALAGTMADLRVHCVAVAGAGRRKGADEHLLWGLVSDMDLVHAAHRGELRTPASELASSAPLALPEIAGLDRAATLMANHDATHVVAVGHAGLPSGVVSTLDVLRVLAAG